MNIFYCCKILDNEISLNNLLENKHNSVSYISKPYETIQYTNLDKLLISLESLINVQQFNNGLFYIDICDIDEPQIEDKILKIINKIKIKNKSIKFERPSSKKSWIDLLHSIICDYGDDYYIINMNHDHNLVGDVGLLRGAVDYLKLNNITNGMVAYSHIQELIANNVFNNNKMIEINGSGYYSESKKIDWFDSIYVTKLSLLKEIFNKMNLPCKNFYLPRPDWAGVFIKPIKVKILVPNDIVFDHFDGYNHVTSFEAKFFEELIYKTDDHNIKNYYMNFIKTYYFTIFLNYKNNQNYISNSHFYKKLLLSYCHKKSFDSIISKNFISYGIKNYILVSHYMFFDRKLLSKESYFYKLSKKIPIRYKILLKRFFKK